MDPLIGAALIQGGTGVLQAIQGIGQKAAAKKIARNNKRPTYAIASPILDNQALLESRASEGLTDNAKQVYSTGAERGLTASIEAILKGGGSVNNIADIYSSYEGGISKLAVIDEEWRARNTQNMVNQNERYAAELDKEWQINTFAPYADKAQAAKELATAGNNNIWKGVNTVGAAASNYLTSKAYQKEADGVFGGSGNATRQDRQFRNVLPGANVTREFRSQTRQDLDREDLLKPINIDGVLYDPETMQPI